MCARFSLTASGEELADAFELDGIPLWGARYNIAPSQPVLAVRLLGQARHAGELRWGLTGTSSEPLDDDDPALPGFQTVAGTPKGPLVINARSETAATRPLFREAFASGRCLIPADGFYEWRRLEDARRPYRIRRQDGRVFAFAGVATPGGCAILTTEPNELVREIHNRMPVVLGPGDFGRWLAPDTLRGDLEALLRPAPAAEWTVYPVSPRVNKTENDDPGCLEPIDDVLRGTQRRLFDE